MQAAHESRTAAIETKYRRAKLLNVVLAALCAFLIIVLISEMTGGKGPLTAPGASTSESPDASAPASSEGASQSPPASAPERAQDKDPTSVATSDALAMRDPADSMALGDVDAPLAVILWTDMRCPYCGVFNRETLPAIKDEYVNTGKIRFEVRDVAFFGEQSAEASVAARAAGRQGMFDEYLTAVYAAAPEQGKPDLTRERLIQFATEIGVPDINAFEADLDDPVLAGEVAASTQNAQQIGVSSVPFLLIGEQAVAGAQPIGTFRKLLDAELARVQ